MVRRGLGKGKGRGWRNILASDSYRHELSRRGIKSTQVSLSGTQSTRLRKVMLPLLADRTITGYNIVETPHLRPKDKYRLVYSHDQRTKHLNLIVEELRKRKLDFYVVGRKSQFLTEEDFVKTPSQMTIGDITTNPKEYQLIVDMDAKELKSFEQWLKTKAVYWDEPIQFLDGAINPTVPLWETIPLKNAYVVPDIRLRNRKQFKDFKTATKVVKKLDKDTSLVILSTRAKKTKAIREHLKGERVDKVLVQNYKPTKHSFWHYIHTKT